MCEIASFIKKYYVHLCIIFNLIKNAMTTKEKQKPEYSSWEDIKAQYPDRFVLIENPVYQTDTPSPFLERGILRYKNKARKKVVEKAKEMKFPSFKIKYTGGPLEEKDYIFVL